MANIRDLLLYLRTRYDRRPFGQAADDLDRVDESAGKAGQSLDDMGDDAARLRTEIDRTNDKVAELHTQVARTGDLTLFGDIRAEQQRLRQLRQTMAAVMPDVGEDAGDSFARGFIRSAGVGGLPSQLRGALILAVIGTLPVVLPVIGAAVAGAVTGAVGLGGIAGGIAAASKDAGVRSAARNFAADISTEFFSGGQAFVQPTIDALSILEEALRDMDLGDTWAKVAPHVTTLARGIADMGREFMPRFNRALDDAGPVLDALALTLPVVGEALGSVFEELAASEGAASGLIFTLNVLSSALVMTARVASWLGDRFHDALQAFAALSGVMEDVPIFPPAVREGWAKLNDDAQRLLHNAKGLPHAVEASIGPLYGSAEAAQELADAVEDANRELSDFFSEEMSAAQAADNYQAALDDVTESFRRNGFSIDANTEKGRANRQALRDAVKAAQAMRDANIASGMSATDANTRYQVQIAGVEKLAAKLGVSRRELENIAGKYTIQVVTTYTNRGSPPVFIKSGAFAGDFRIEYGRVLARQHGGPVEPGGTYLVGEGGRPEVLQMGPQARGHVMPLPAGGVGGNTYTINVSVPPTANLRDVGAEVVSAIQAYEHGNGAGWRQ